MATPDVQQLWKQVTDLVKVRLVRPALWQAMEGARPILIEDGWFVIGFGPQVAHEAGLVMESTNLNIIERALQELAGQSLRVRAIHGETVQDWEGEKRRGEQAAQLQAQAAERRRREAAAGQTWESVSEQLTRRFADTPLRNLPQTQAAFLDDAIGVLAEAVERLMDKPDIPEPDQRAYARTLDKVAERVQIPASLLAWMVRQRLKG